MEERSQPLPKATPKNEIEAVTLVSQGMAGRASNPASPKLSIQMQYKSEDRTFELPLNLDMVGRFAIEAEFRNMRIGELVARLILRIAEQDLFQLVLEQPDQEHDN
jgi:hypothetical protein